MHERGTNFRSVRVASELRKRLIELCRVHAMVPEVRGAMITKVEVSQDLSSAKIYVWSEKIASDRLVSAFKVFSPRLRLLLARTWTQKKMPSFQYCFDHGESEQRKIRLLLDE